MATLIPEGKQSYTNSAGEPLVGGRLYTYDAGTNNPRPTYQDAAGLVPNTNPVVLDARGEAVVFWSGAYKAVLRDASDVIVWTVDNLLSVDQYAADVSTDLTAFIADLADTTDVAKGDTLIGVKQPYVGAIGLTQHQKNIESLSVRDFGAVGDFNENTGVGTDDTAAIQACIDAVASNSPGRGVVYIPRGSYKITANLNVPYGVSIKGSGGTSSLIFAVGCDAIRFTTYGYSIGSMVYEDFGVSIFSGNNFAAFVTLANASTMDGLYINRVRMYGWNQCIIFQSNWNCTISNCVAENINQFLVCGSGNGESIGIRVLNNRINKAAGGFGTGDRTAIEYAGTVKYNESVHIYQNQIYGFDICVKLSQALFVNIIGNDMSSTVTCITYVDAEGGYRILDNYIECNGGKGIVGANQASDTTTARTNIERNYFIGNGAATNGVQLGSAGGTFQFGAVVKDNVFVGFTNSDITVFSPGRHYIEYNRCLSTAPTNSLFIEQVASQPTFVRWNWFQRAMYLDYPADYANGNLILEGNVEGATFQSRRLAASPVAGSWRTGDIVYNSTPATGLYVGWVCTAGGIPGTWKPFGLIA